MMCYCSCINLWSRNAFWEVICRCPHTYFSLRLGCNFYHDRYPWVKSACSVIQELILVVICTHLTNTIPHFVNNFVALTAP